MPTPQEQYDDAMFAFTTGDFDACIATLKTLLAAEPENFEAQLALGMAHYRKGEYATAIAEGHRAEKLRPNEQLVHTNLSLFYMKSGDKKTAEHHGLQARIASWRENMAPPGATAATAETADPELSLTRPAPAPIKVPAMPWKKKSPGDGAAHTH